MNSPAGRADRVLHRFKHRMQEVYFRTDWLTVTMLVVIGALAVGMFFFVVSLGEYRMNR